MNFEGWVPEQTIVQPRGTKYLAKTFALPDVRPGSIIEYSYTYNAILAIELPDLFESHWSNQWLTNFS